MGKNTENQVTVISNTALAEATFETPGVGDMIADESIRSYVLKYLKASVSINKDMWTMYKAVASMMMDNQHRVVFGTDYELARFLNVSNSTLSKMNRIANMGIGTKTLDEYGYTTAQAEEMLPAMKYMTAECLLLYTDISPSDKRDDIRDKVKAAVKGLKQHYKKDSTSKNSVVDAKKAEEIAELLDMEDTRRVFEYEEHVEERKEELEDQEKIDEHDRYNYTLPVFESGNGTDGVFEREFTFTSYDELEKFAKMVSKFANNSKHIIFND